MSLCLHLPDGRTAFSFWRAHVAGNGLAAGGLEWTVEDSFRSNRVRFGGEAYRHSRKVTAEVDLLMTSGGLSTVMGPNQDDVDRVFLPGQPD